MPKFLNTNLINEWIPKIIAKAKRELVIIVPYIKLSDSILKELVSANARGVETLFIFRENKLSPIELDKLKAIDNLNLMQHPNIHCKCYYNGEALLIGSMNLHEYSEKNNREMAILMVNEINLASTLYGSMASPDDDKVFIDVVKEINAIRNGSEVIKLSKETIHDGFEMDIIKTPYEKALEQCQKLNKVFVHKKFEPYESFNTWELKCTNYFDNIDVVIELSRRATIQLTFPKEKIAAAHNKAKASIHEYIFDGYKFYWNSPQQQIHLYPSANGLNWKNAENDPKILLSYKHGLDQTISWLRNFI